MRERFAHWAALMLAVALVLVGRPDARSERDDAHDALSAGQIVAPLLLSEERRTPAVRNGAGVGQSNPNAAMPLVAVLVVEQTLTLAVAVALLEWRAPGRDVLGVHRTPASARGPPHTLA